MLIQQASRDEPETIDIMVRNNESVVAAVGMGMNFVQNGNGIDAELMDVDTDMQNFAGIVLEGIPAGREGLVRAFGKVNTILIEKDSAAILAGDFLGPSSVPGRWLTGIDYALLATFTDTLGHSLKSDVALADTSPDDPVVDGFVRAM